jgi:O-antigen/teichoic acid export membrane protein
MVAMQSEAERTSGESNRRDASWDISQGPRNYATLVGTQFAGALFSLLAVWLATRALGTDGYGGVVAIIAASQCVGQVAVNWTAISLSRYGCQEFTESGSIAKTFWARLSIVALTLVLVLATTPLWLPAVGFWLRISPSGYPLVVGHLIATAVWTHVQQGLLGAKLPRLQGGLLAVERLLIVVTLVALYFGGKVSPPSLLVIYILAPLIVSMVALWRLRQLIFPIKGVDGPSLRQIVIFSLPLFPSSVIGYLSTNYLDAFFLTHFLSLAALGMYSVAYQLTGTILQPALLAGSLLLPLFVSSGAVRQARIARFVAGVLPLVTLIWSMICVAAAAVASYLVPLIFGSNFQAVVPTLWPLFAAAALAGPTLMGYFPISNTNAMTYVSAVNATISATLNVGLNFILIPRFGLVGCAWATMLAFVITLAVTAYLIGRLYPEGRMRAPLATLPAIAAATIFLWIPNALVAVSVSLFVMLIIIVLLRESLVAGLAALQSVGSFQRMPFFISVRSST